MLEKNQDRWSGLSRFADVAASEAWLESHQGKVCDKFWPDLSCHKRLVRRGAFYCLNAAVDAAQVTVEKDGEIALKPMTQDMINKAVGQETSSLINYFDQIGFRSTGCYRINETATGIELFFEKTMWDRAELYKVTEVLDRLVDAF